MRKRYKFDSAGCMKHSKVYYSVFTKMIHNLDVYPVNVGGTCYFVDHANYTMISKFGRYNGEICYSSFYEK